LKETKQVIHFIQLKLFSFCSFVICERTSCFSIMQLFFKKNYC